MTQSHLKVIVLRSLEKKSMSGYDLVKDIAAATHWKPSFGSIYPLLKDLHSKSLVSVRTSGRRKIYSISPKGRQALKDIFKTKDRIYNMTMESLKGLEAVCTPKELDFVRRLHLNLRTNLMPFKEATNEMTQFTEVMMNLADENKIAMHEKEIRQALSQTITKLKRIEERK